MQTYIAYAPTTKEYTMTEREIAILECIRFIKRKRGYRSARTSYDMGTIDDAIVQLVQEIEEEFNVKEVPTNTFKGRP
jgi:protoporphyrinogen oxidase